MLLYLPILAILAFKLRYLLTGDQVAGWDTVPHLYLANLMSGYLSQGKLSGWDENWYAGYPAFSLYPPLGYIVLLIPWIGSLGTIPVTVSFNLVLYTLPFILLISAIFIGQRRGSPELGFLATLGFLLIPGVLGNFGNGLYGFLVTGNIHGLTAFILLLFGIDELFGKERVSRLTLFFSLLILTHLLSAVFFLSVIATRFLFSTQKHKIVFALALTAIATSFWTVPFLKLLSVSSGEIIGSFKDPIFLILSDLSPDHINRILWVFSKLSFWEILAGLPWISFTVILVFWAYVKKFGFDSLVISFGICLLLLPRNIFTEFFDTAIHYYRFAPMLWAFVIVMATRVEIKARWLLAPFVLILFFRFDLLSPTKLDPHPPFPGRLSEAPGKKVADEIVEYFRANPPKGRVIEEVVGSNLSYFGSPHIFTARLPLELGVKMGTGLLAESALCSEAFQAPLAALTRHEIWGGGGRWLTKEFLLQPSSLHIQRLQFLGVSHVIVSSARGRRIFGRFKEVKRVYSSSMADVFELPKREFLAAQFRVEILHGDVFDIAKSMFFNQHLFGSPPLFSLQDSETKGVILIPGLAPNYKLESRKRELEEQGLEVIVAWGPIRGLKLNLKGSIPVSPLSFNGKGMLVPPCFTLG